MWGEPEGKALVRRKQLYLIILMIPPRDAKHKEKKLQDSKALELKRFLQNTFPNVKKLLQIQGNLGVNALQICAKLI